MCYGRTLVHMDTRRVFVPGVLAKVEHEIGRYRREFTTTPFAIVLHPADADPRAEELRVAGCTVVRSESVQRGEVRVVGHADHGVAWVG